MLLVCLFLLAGIQACAWAYEGMPVAPGALELGEASDGGSATLTYLFHGISPPMDKWKAWQHAQVPEHHTRHKRQGADLYLPESFVIPGGAGEGPWGDWGELSPCSRTCGGGVASQKRICLPPKDQSQCSGGDTKYVSCQTQDCPDGSGDFRAEQCAELNDKLYKGIKYSWVPYTKASDPCKLNCMPHGERFYLQHKLQVTDGTRCNDESFDVCVNGTCQPVGCDMMLNSTAQEDKCRECRGTGANCRTTDGIYDSKDLLKGYNDIFLIPAGATNINIEEIEPSNNYLALRAKNGTYYLNGHYHIDYPRKITITGALWTYERSQQASATPDKLRSLGPTTEPLYLSLLLLDQNVGISYEYSVPNNSAPPTYKRYDWVHEQFTPCSATCGGGFQTRNVTCRTRQLEVVEDSLCDEGLKPPSSKSCNPDPCPAHWVEGPWGECSQKCGSGCVRSREVTCQKIIANGVKPVGTNQVLLVPDKECFDLLGPKPKVFQKCNEDAPCPTWFVGHWNPCDKLCDKGKQSRQVVCYQKKDGRIEVLDDERCIEEKPEEEQPCMLQPCDGIDWVTTAWSGCDTCTSKFRTRMVLCTTKNGPAMNESFCSFSDRPVDREACSKDELPTCKVQWYTTYWDKCSVNCGEGVQTRQVFCGMYYEDKSRPGVEIVEDENCVNLTKYNDTRPCNVPKEECPSQWFAGPWSECTAPEDGEQFRHLMCFQSNKQTIDCDPSTLLDPTQLCNRQLNSSPGPFKLPPGIAGVKNATVTGGLGSSIKLRCLAYGYPPPSVLWYRIFDEEAILIQNDTKYEIRGNDLIIKHLSIDNVGQYSCGAYNGVGLAVSWKVVVQACEPEWLFIENEWILHCAVLPRPSVETNTTTIRTSTEAPTPFTAIWTKTTVFVPSRVCKPWKLKCSKTKFGCCPDGKIAASGTFNDGCEKPHTCKESSHGCCPDGLSPAQGDNNEGCPVEPCADTLFGCCTSDNKTAAQGNDQDGCPPPACTTSTYGCCADNETEATGPEKAGCPEKSNVGTTSVISTTTLDPCSSFEFGCCADNETEASGPDGQGCPCYDIEFGCCPDEVSPGIEVPAKCTDDIFADCNVIVSENLCKYKSLIMFCCKSCVEAGQLDPEEVELQAD